MSDQIGPLYGVVMPPAPPDQTPVVVYSAQGVELSLPFDPAAETVWATPNQIADLFRIDRSTVTRHINSLVASGEIDEANNVQNLHEIRRGRPTKLYSLDVILSVGYRTNSERAVDFRKWASGVLKQYLIAGVAINDKRIEQLGVLVQVLSHSTDPMVLGVVDVLARYMPGLQLLRDYDEGHVSSAPEAVPSWTLTLDEARVVIRSVGAQFPQDTLFGGERGHGLESVIHSIYATMFGDDLYTTVEEKAANLLYLVVKDHPLSDGNKRSGAALFVTFLSRNGMLFSPNGEPRFGNHELAMITLMVAMSEPREKDVMIALITRLITG